MGEWPYMKDIVIASDAVAYTDENGELLPIEAPLSAYGGHPRNAGSNGIVFRIAREKNIPLMDIVNNVSYVAAKYLSKAGLKSMQERGRLQENMIADITIFNPKTIAEASSMKIGERGLPTKGISHVIVGGQLSIENGVANIKIRAGKAIRYPIIEGEMITAKDFDWGDKKYQWHADLPGYPATRFPPEKGEKPPTFELEHKH
jgi:N-acyl-D-amino-acid deacylase